MTNLSDKTLLNKILTLKFHFIHFQQWEMINMEFGIGPVLKAKRMRSLHWFNPLTAVGGLMQ